MDVKQQVDTHYKTGNETTFDALFYSIGPGLTYKTSGVKYKDWFGQVMIDPSAENRADALADNNSHATYNKAQGLGTGTPAGLVNMLQNNLTAEELEYVNYADWSVAGDLSSSDISDAFSTIVEKIGDIPRPITAVTIVDTQTNEELFDGKNMVFTDTIGEDMGLACVDANGNITSLDDAPTVLYCNDNGTAYTATAVTATTVYAEGSTTETVGTKYTFIYRYSVKEASTGKDKDLSTMEVNLYVYNNGKQKVEWKIPADLVPVIYPDISGTEPTFTTTDPIRLNYRVELKTDRNKTVNLPVNKEKYNTSTDLYYEITDAVTFTDGQSNVILITNTGNALISITNLKIAHTAPEPTMVMTAAPRLMMTSAGALSAIQCANANYLQSITPATEPTTQEEPTTEPIEEPSTNPAEESTTKSPEESTTKPVEESTTKTAEEPTTEPIEPKPQEETGFFAMLKKLFERLIAFFKSVFERNNNNPALPVDVPR